MTGFAGLAESAELARERYGELRAYLPEHFLRRFERSAQEWLARTQEQTARIRGIPEIPAAADSICVGENGIPAGENGIPAGENGISAGADGIPVMEGGVRAALWEIGEQARKAGGEGGLTADLARIPVRQETVEICEALGLDPYALPSGGCIFLLENGAWSGAAVIGHLTPGKARTIRTRSGLQYLEKPRMRPDMLDREKTRT